MFFFSLCAVWAQRLGTLSSWPKRIILYNFAAVTAWSDLNLHLFTLDIISRAHQRVHSSERPTSTCNSIVLNTTQTSTSTKYEGGHLQSKEAAQPRCSVLMCSTRRPELYASQYVGSRASKCDLIIVNELTNILKYEFKKSSL